MHCIVCAIVLRFPCKDISFTACNSFEIALRDLPSVVCAVYLFSYMTIDMPTPVS